MTTTAQVRYAQSIMASGGETETWVVLSTASNDDEGRRLARALVERRLAACVNVVPGVRSVYVWQGEVCDEAEVLLVAKTRRERACDLARAIRELHSYDVPEIVALPAAFVDSDYAAWLGDALA